MAPILDWFIGYPRTQKRYLGGGPSLRLVDYHPYINATVFRHLLFKSPGIPPLRFLLDMIPPEEERAWRSRFSARPSFNVLGSLLRETILEQRWERFAWNPLTNHREWDRFKSKLANNLPLLKRRARSSSDAIDLLSQHENWIRNYIRIHVTSLLYANLFYQALEQRITSLAPEESRTLLDALAHSSACLLYTSELPTILLV